MVVQEISSRARVFFTYAAMAAVAVITSCQSPAASSDLEVQEEEEVIRSSQENHRMSDFTAVGNEPYWRLDIDFEEGMYLSGLSVPNEIKTPLPEREELEKGGFRYSAEVESGKLIVEVYPGKCTDSMSGQEFPFTVKCSNGEMEYLGCGNFNADSSLLGGEWTLVYMNDEILEEARNMTLLLDTRMAGISGMDGCNRFFGSAEISNDRLMIGQGLGSTLMACEDMDVSQKYTALLTSGELLLLVDDDRLTLLNESGSLKFKRK